MKQLLYLIFAFVVIGCSNGGIEMQDLTNNKYIQGIVIKKPAINKIGIINYQRGHNQNSIVFIPETNTVNIGNNPIWFKAKSTNGVSFAYNITEQEPKSDDKFSGIFNSGIDLHSFIEHGHGSTQIHVRGHIKDPKNAIQNGTYYEIFIAPTLTSTNFDTVYVNQANYNYLKRIFEVEFFYELKMVGNKKIIENISRCHSHPNTKEICIDWPQNLLY